MTTVRIACGNSSNYTDTLGNLWAADNSYTGGTAHYEADPIANTVDDLLFQNERWGAFSYSISIPNGDYVLNLGFAETVLPSAGQRVFNVTAQGNSILTSYDILTQTPTNTALIKSFLITVSAGTVNLVFTNVVENPKINNIEIIPLASTDIRIICGATTNYTDALSRVWVADNSFTTGGTAHIEVNPAPVANTTEDTLFQYERYGTFSYSIPVANGNYKLNLGFSENVWITTGQRIFSVSAEGNSILSSFDILSEVAIKTALIKTFSITVTDNVINLVFTTIVDNAKINNIEILHVTYYASPLMLLAC
jgi:hypothetical protein